MTDNRKAGLALLCGSLGGVFAMAGHPTAGTSHLELLSPVAHGLAIASVWLLFLGAIGLTVFMNEADRFAIAALVAFGLATVSVLIATSISGFIVPTLLTRMSRDGAAAASQWQVVIGSFYQTNQAFSKIYSIATAVSITLWSICLLRQRAPKGIGVYGVVASPGIAFLIFIGHLRLDIHGMIVVMLSEVVWFVCVGVWLCRSNEKMHVRKAI